MAGAAVSKSRTYSSLHSSCHLVELQQPLHPLDVHREDVLGQALVLTEAVHLGVGWELRFCMCLGQ